MRPVRLVLEGFGAFKERTEVDFDDTDFFAFVGPTGSGKSTVVDAICFALYGSVPRYGDERLVGSAMSVGYQETKVVLTFEVAGQRHDAARVVRRDRHGKVTTKEARLEAADGTVLAGRAKEMGPAVERLLGLPFAHFTRCVVLPQGEFARFLHDKAADRQELLVALLDLRVYERVAQEANRRASAFEATARLADQQLVSLAGATPEAVEAARARAGQLTTFLAALDEAAPRLAVLHEQVAVAARAVAGLGDLVVALDAVGVPEQVRSLAAELDDAREALELATSEHLVAVELARQAAEAMAGLPALEVLKMALGAHDDLADVCAQLDAAERRRAEADLVLVAAAGDEHTAEEAAQRAETAHEAARQEFAAHLLAERLQVGEACPVCGQEVHEVPAVAPPADLRARREGVEAAQQALERERTRHRQAEVAAERARSTADQLRARVSSLETRLGEHPDRPTLEALVAEVTSAHELEQATRRQERDRAAVAEARRRAVDELRARVSDLAATYHTQRDRLSTLGPPAPGDDLVDAWRALEAWAAPQRLARAEELARAEAERARASAQQVALLGELAEEAARVGVTVPADASEDVTALHRAAARAGAAAEEQVAALTRDLDTVARLSVERDAAQERRVVAAELGRLLSARGFERWMVAEALHRLAHGASITLHRLSGGQFSLVLDEGGEFAVIDHGNGDELRPVRTLSGGETFQASLALALALADELSALAACGAAKLDAIFLDEGFGTLDPDSLETVAATIEALGTSGRMVGIVTHVRELAARVPVRYEVRKGPTSSTVERVVG